VLDILADLQQFASQLEPLGPSNLLEADDFQDPFNSILRRAFALDGHVDSDSEALRLGIIIFLALNTFYISHSTFKRTCFKFLARKMREACRQLQPLPASRAPINLWLLLLGTMLVFNVEEEEWLLKSWAAAAAALPGAAKSWDEAREHLRQVCWMPLFDKLGETAYRSLSR
jgi:hypothetical protein